MDNILIKAKSECNHIEFVNITLAEARELNAGFGINKFLQDVFIIHKPIMGPDYKHTSIFKEME